jgi:hypothetical protein
MSSTWSLPVYQSGTAQIKNTEHLLALHLIHTGDLLRLCKELKGLIADCGEMTARIAANHIRRPAVGKCLLHCYLAD